uniref:Uncharacterized protein n=1 Tax=Micrurus surinamensis TaxID=129470 RepID=A0A2D4NWR9_MICSU
MGLGDLPVVDGGGLPTRQSHGEGGHVPSSKDGRGTGLHEQVHQDGTSSVKPDGAPLDEAGVWSDADAHHHQVCRENRTVAKKDAGHLPAFSLHLGHLCLHVETNSLRLEHLGERGRHGSCCIALIQSRPLRGCPEKPR